MCAVSNILGHPRVNCCHEVKDAVPKLLTVNRAVSVSFQREWVRRHSLVFILPACRFPCRPANRSAEWIPACKRHKACRYDLRHACSSRFLVVRVRRATRGIVHVKRTGCDTAAADRGSAAPTRGGDPCIRCPASWAAAQAPPNFFFFLTRSNPLINFVYAQASSPHRPCKERRCRRTTGRCRKAATIGTEEFTRSVLLEAWRIPT